MLPKAVVGFSERPQQEVKLHPMGPWLSLTLTALSEAVVPPTFLDETAYFSQVWLICP